MVCHGAVTLTRPCTSRRDTAVTVPTVSSTQPDRTVRGAVMDSTDIRHRTAVRPATVILLVRIDLAMIALCA